MAIALPYDIQSINIKLKSHLKCDQIFRMKATPWIPLKAKFRRVNGKAELGKPLLKKNTFQFKVEITFIVCRVDCSEFQTLSV